MNNYTKLEILEYKLYRATERFNETDPASDDYRDQWDELQMLDHEIELILSEKEV